MDQEMKVILENILGKLDSIEKRQGNMEQQQVSMLNRLDNMEQQQASMLNRLDNMEQQQVSMLNRLDSMEQQQVSMLKRQESMEKRQDEIFSIVKAIEHSNLVRKAEIDNLTHKVAKIEGVITGIGKVIQKSAI